MTLAAAGIVAPIWFTALVIVQSILQPDYSQMAQPISALAAWPAGWLQNVNFWVFGLLMVAYGIALHRGVRSKPGFSIGLTLLLISGAGPIVAGLFPWRRVGEDFVVPPAHRIGAVLAFLGAGLSLIAMSRRMKDDARWRDLSTYALASGVTMVILFVVQGPLAIPDTAPLHEWAGLLQRITVLVWFACTILLSLRLLRIEREGTA